MPDLDEILITLSNELLPSGIQFTLLLFALVGSYMIALSLVKIYYIVDGSQQYVSNSSEGTVGGNMIRILLGALMVTPSVTLWRAADAFLQGGGTTESDILAYISGPGGTPSYCERFSDAIQLAFMLVGLIGIYMAYRNADDQARGFNPNGYRTAVPYFLGGLACFFVNDIIGVVGATLGIDVGFDALCAAFDG